MKTQIVAILDRSTSMRGSELDVINNFNQFVKDQKKIPGKAELTLIMFDSVYQTIFHKKKLKNVPKLTREDYWTRGYTALYDAVGKALSSFGKNDKVIVLIHTDGEENASKEYTKEKIQKLVKNRKKAGWEFLFVGQDLDSARTHQIAVSIGVPLINTISVSKDSTGFKNMNRFYGAVTTSYRTEGGLDRNMLHDLKDQVDQGDSATI